jgi:hypothetical protein
MMSTDSFDSAKISVLKGKEISGKLNHYQANPEPLLLGKIVSGGT